MKKIGFVYASLAIALALGGCVLETTVGDGTCGSCSGDCDGNPQNGCEVDLMSQENCGACGHACVGSEICLEGGTCWDPDSALIGAWKFDEATSTAITDASSHSMNGSMCAYETATTICDVEASGPVRTTGHNGRGLLFDGVNDGVVVPYNPTIQPTTLSMEAWINWNGDVDGTQQRIIEQSRADSGYTQANYAMTIQPSGTVQIEVRVRETGDESVEMFETGVVLSTFEWTHLVATYDGQKIVVYRNGVNVGEQAAQGDIKYNESVRGDLGIGNQSARNRAYHGILDDVRLYNRALTATEVDARFHYTR